MHQRAGRQRRARLDPGQHDSSERAWKGKAYRKLVQSILAPTEPIETRSTGG